MFLVYTFSLFLRVFELPRKNLLHINVISFILFPEITIFIYTPPPPPHHPKYSRREKMRI